MSDIVERLRSLADRERPYGSLPDTLDEAANEISRLRAALREIAENPTGGVGCNPEGFVKKARAALGGE